MVGSAMAVSSWALGQEPGLVHAFSSVQGCCANTRPVAPPRNASRTSRRLIRKPPQSSTPDAPRKRRGSRDVACGSGLGFGRVQFDGAANERLQRLLVDLLAFA